MFYVVYQQLAEDDVSRYWKKLTQRTSHFVAELICLRAS